MGNQNVAPGSQIGQLKARGVCVDMEEGVISGIKKSSISKLFDDHQFIVSNSGSGNNWGQGYHEYGREYGEIILNSLRKEAEFCDSLQSILMIQSTGGGTGSGLGSWVAQAIADEFPQLWKFTAGVVPSPNDDVVTSPYNSILSLWKLSTCTDCILPVDNQSLYTIYEKIQKVPVKQRLPLSTLIDNGGIKSKKNDAFNTMNNIVANLILNMTRLFMLTSSMRFEGNLNVDINDIVTNLVPFPNLKYISSSMTPFFQHSDMKSSTKLIDQVFNDVFQSDSHLVSVEPKQSVYLASALIARGAIHISDLRRNIDKIQSQLRFVPWNQDGWKTGLVDVPPLGQQYSVLSLSNNTAIWRVLERIEGRFKKLFKKKAHLHHYLEYMEPEEFTNAQCMVSEVITEYQRIEHSC